MPDDEEAQERRIERRAAELLPEEEAAGSADPDSFVEHRTSDEATPPA